MVLMLAIASLVTTIWLSTVRGKSILTYANCALLGQTAHAQFGQDMRNLEETKFDLI